MGQASKDYMVPFLGKIPLDPQIIKSSDSGKTFMIKNPKSNTAKAFQSIAENIEKIVNKKEVK